MKLKTTMLLLLFVGYLHQTSYSQEDDQTCSCLNLKESEENNAKVIALAQDIETSFHQLDTKGFDEKFDIDAFIHNLTESEVINRNDAFTQGFIKGIENTGRQLSQQIVNSIESGTYYNLINYHYSIEDMAYYFTFRLYSEEIGVNYHDYKVCSDGENIKFNDLYIYLTGEPLSATMQRLFLLSKLTENTLSKTQNAKDNSIKTIVEARKLAKEGNYEAAYNKMSQITGPMAKEKFNLIIKASYASAYNNEIYEKTLEEFESLYPNDPTLYLKQVDNYILKGNFDKAINNIDKLIYETSDDFLNLLKGNTYFMKKDYVQAEVHYKYMTENYPNLLEGYVGYMVSLNFQNRFDEIITVIEHLISEAYDKKVLLEFLEEKEPDGTNLLKAFVTSSTYKTWKRKA
jgi:tetratricopeptide (TPR) repeat protein